MFAFMVVPVLATTIDEKVEEVKALEAKISLLQTQGKTLSNQIAAYDGQIALAQLKISQTEDMIASVSGRISKLENELRSRSELLEKQIVASYKRGKIDPLTILFSSNGVTNLMANFKYLRVVQSQSSKFLYEGQKVQFNYIQQKALIEESKKKLQAQKVILNSYRIERDNLLKQTKSSEANYQNQLVQARSELEAIQRAMANAVQEGQVKTGDVIGLMGNSGYPYCSTAEHLHFEVRKNDVWTNAENYLKNTVDKWGLNIGSGSWDWPMSGGLEITQRYGKTDFSWRYAYSGGIHTGIDMVSSDKAVRAVADGTLYSSQEKCGSATIKLKYIDHGNGLKSLYLHLQ